KKSAARVHWFSRPVRTSRVATVTKRGADENSPFHLGYPWIVSGMARTSRADGLLEHLFEAEARGPQLPHRGPGRDDELEDLARIVQLHAHLVVDGLPAHAGVRQVRRERLHAAAHAHVVARPRGRALEHVEHAVRRDLAVVEDEDLLGKLLDVR